MSNQPKNLDFLLCSVHSKKSSPGADKESHCSYEREMHDDSEKCAAYHECCMGIQTQSSYREPAHCAQSANFDQVLIILVY